MAFLLFNEVEKKTGDVAMRTQCGSAIFNYQVLNGTVEFSGSNVPNPDVHKDEQWIPIVTMQAGVPDSEPFRQHVWHSIRYKVLSGNNVQIYVTSGVAG